MLNMLKITVPRVDYYGLESEKESLLAWRKERKWV